MRCRETGFSLIELLIGVAVVAILAAIAIPNFGLMLAKSKQSEAKANLNDIYVMQRQFHAEYQRYGSMDELRWMPLGNNLYGYCLSFQTDDCVEPAVTFDVGAGDWGGDFGGWIEDMNAFWLPGNGGVTPLALRHSPGILLGLGAPILAATNSQSDPGLPGGGNAGGGPPADDNGDDAGQSQSGGASGPGAPGGSTGTSSDGTGGGGSDGGSGNGGQEGEGEYAPGGPSGPGGVGNPHYTATTFEADAYGVIRDGKMLDCWSINQDGQLLNYNPGYQ